MTTEHIITREMLIAAWGDAIQQRDAALKELATVERMQRENHLLVVQNHPPLQESLHMQRINQLVSENELLKRDNMLLTVKNHPPLQERTQLEHRIKELHLMIEKLQLDLDDVTKQRDLLRDELELSKGVRPSAYEGDVELQKKLLTVTNQRDRLLTELTDAKLHNDDLKKRQCQCVPVLEEKNKNLRSNLDVAQETILRLNETTEKLKSQLPATMQHCTIRVEECENGHTLLTATNWVAHPCPWCIHTKLRTLFETHMNANEMLMSNPPKNIVAYRGLEILREGEARYDRSF